jgi:ABC-2 type transport system permease protein
VFVGMIDAVAVLVAGLIGGVRLTAGIPGLVVVVVLAMLVALSFSSIGAFVAARTGSSDATQSVFPLFFILMIFSSYFMPRNLLGVGWFKTIATYNPATYIIEALRSPIVHGWDARALGLGIAAVSGLCIIGFGGAAAALRTRLARV